MLFPLKRPLLALLLAATAPAHAATSQLPGKELWLFGGGEKICSSVEPEYCEASQLKAAQAYFARLQAQTGKAFRCDAKALQVLQQLPHWPVDGDSELRRNTLLPALGQQLAKTHSSAQLRAFAEQFQLNDDEQSVIEDSCELRPQLPDGRTASMAVYWPGTATITKQLFQSFISSARERKQARWPDSALSARPKLLLITASSYNPYEWVDYYQALFTAAGADVLWLPLEPALSQQTQPWDCSAIEAGRLRHSGQLRRAERYPELAAQQQQRCQNPKALADLVEQADAVFINGGDQSLTLRALTGPDGQWLPLVDRLLKRVRFEGVPLGGSSAGNAVQAGRPLGDIAMISGGRSSHALQYGALAHDIDAPLCRVTASCGQTLADEQLTYRPQGGIQLFSLGISDTHFRERNREGRLLRLVLDAKAPAGFGVDEATVLRARFARDSDGNGQDAQLTVLGSGAVWIIDRTAAHGDLVERDLAKQAGRTAVDNLRVSRLLPGDSLHWRQLPDGTVQYQGELACGASASTPASTTASISAAAVDAEAYAPLSQPGLSARWLLGNAGQVAACQRSDGDWHYLAQPLSLQLTLPPAQRTGQPHAAR